ncbi:MAG TPA: hypothetical protein VMS37_05495, partial [Verrucomicrobiae bacterium]|nr:hypothetical protein [Verrucomicrobiae bacterium]
MEDIQQQLADLRKRIARVDRKWAAPSPARTAKSDRPPHCGLIDELMSGEVVTTPLGQHFETERLWEN